MLRQSGRRGWDHPGMASAQEGVIEERLTFVGHSTVLLEMGSARILTDPLLRERVLHIRRLADSPAPSVMRDIDCVLLSHLHPDHLDPPSLRMLGKGMRILAPVGSRRVLRRRGFREVEEMEPGEVIRVGGAVVGAFAVKHEGRRLPVGRDVQALGFEVRGGSSVLFAGDTAPFDMSGLPSPDVALLPIAGWGPNLRTKHHLDPRTAAEAAAAIGARTVVPIHWGTMLRAGLKGRSDELLRGPAHEFAAQMARVAPEVTLRVLAPGRSMALVRS